MSEQFTCTLSNNQYCGPCKIEQCHAHIDSTKHNSSCLYVFYDYKKQEFDKYDIMYAYNLKDKSYRNIYNEGWEKVSCLITLYKVIRYLRDTNVKEQCNHCGIFQKYKNNRIRCENTQACDARHKIILNVFQQSNLAYPEMKSSLKDLYLLIKHKQGVQQYIDQIKNTFKPNLYQLFGLDQAVFVSLTKIETEIQTPKKELVT